MMKQALLNQPVRAPAPPQGAPHVANVPQTLSTTPRPLAVTLVAVFCAISGMLGLSLLFVPFSTYYRLVLHPKFALEIMPLLNGGLGLIMSVGIIVGMGIWAGKTWARRLGILYLILEIALVGYVELGILNCYYCGQNLPRVIAVALSVTLVLAGCYAIVLLFQANVLDYFYPRHAPHRKWAEQSLAVAAWSQILLGFWLVIPLILGIGLLHRKRWALVLDYLLLWVITGIAILAFVVGLTGQSNHNWQSFVLMSVIAQLLFLFSTINLFLLTRREVSALF